MADAAPMDDISDVGLDPDALALSLAVILDDQLKLTHSLTSAAEKKAKAAFVAGQRVASEQATAAAVAASLALELALAAQLTLTHTWISAAEVEVAADVVVTRRLASEQAAAAAIAAALALELALTTQRNQLDDDKAAAVRRAADLATKLAREEAKRCLLAKQAVAHQEAADAAAVAVEAELAVEAALEQGRAAIRAALKRGVPCGFDDMGTTFESLAKLSEWQDENRLALYAANVVYWDDSGAAGTSDEVAMTGDGEGSADIADSHRFLLALLVRMPQLRPSSGLDAGAGVGRVTKHLLLRHCSTVHLVESSDPWCTRSRRYLGKKLVKRCTFTRSRLEEFIPRGRSTDLIWVQVRVRVACRSPFLS